MLHISSRKLLRKQNQSRLLKVELNISGVFLVVGGATVAAVLLLLVECILAGLGCGMKLKGMKLAGINVESSHPESHSHASGYKFSNVAKDTEGRSAKSVCKRHRTSEY